MSSVSNLKKLLWACVCVIGVACTKNSSTPEPGSPTEPANPSANAKLYPVNFSVGNIDISNGRIASKEIAVRNYFRYLLYAAYDSNGRLVSKIEQDSSFSQRIGAEFGVINDSLPAGNYTILVMGALGKPYIGDSYNALNTLYFQTTNNDVFYKKFDVSVSVKDTATTNVKLERITGQLQLTLTEALPAEVKYVTLSFDNFPVNYYPSTDSLGGFRPVNWALPYYRDQDPYTTTPIDVFGSSYLPYTVRIEGQTENFETVCEKVVNNVYVYPNKRTSLKGSIKMDYSGSMIVTIDTSYAETINQNFRKK